MLTVHLDAQGSYTAKAKELKPILEETHEQIGLDWHEKKLPGHFKYSAYQKYGYKPRSIRYERRKQRGYRDKYGVQHAGHRRPMVWSGESERDMTSGARINASSKLLRVTMNAPKHFFAFRKDLNQPNLAIEATTLSDPEVKEYAKFHEDYTTKQLNAVNTRESRTL